MKAAAWLSLGLFLTGVGAAHAAELECDPSIKETGVPDALWIVFKSVINDHSYSVPCESLALVLRKLAGHSKTGGRRLEEDKPLNTQQAQGNLREALSNPEIRARIEKMQSEVKDENARLVYEAAILDEEGYYDARELKIQQLQQKLY
ncbi:hypothetical protein SAMN05216420_104218 [Nitrosospira sp. Nl5]|uniref:hypothetical protein n=1 Tax=Nitrosospira sp. Nl5 TaxID=200120 RepID=UPI00088199E3|nr:hypothetical protein [Nitrosospira sp. Nl5]SCY31667.1 hypothetical protein SAMN05216420_104218 [Nitrosospira sp. Nl5]